jgi:hypothetical protein
MPRRLFPRAGLRARELHAWGALVPRGAGWSRDEEPTFGDALAALRRSLWVEAARVPALRPTGDRVEVRRALLDRPTDLARHAA